MLVLYQRSSKMNLSLLWHYSSEVRDAELDGCCSSAEPLANSQQQIIQTYETLSRKLA